MVGLSSKSVLPAMLQPLDEAFRQIVLAHPPQNGGDVIGNPARFPDVSFNVEQRVGRIRVLVARLSHTAGVNDLAAPIQLPPHAVGWRYRFGFTLFADLFVNDGLVRVSDEAVRGFK